MAVRCDTYRLLREQRLTELFFGYSFSLINRACGGRLGGWLGGGEDEVKAAQKGKRVVNPKVRSKERLGNTSPPSPPPL